MFDLNVNKQILMGIQNNWSAHIQIKHTELAMFYLDQT